MKHHDANNNNMITDRDAEQVTGGVSWGDWFDSELDYSSGDEPKYSVGMRITYRHGMKLSTGEPIVKGGEIVKVNLTKSGIINKEFTYDIKKDEGGIDHDVYESAILSGY